jgi:hypothetical protein
VPGRRNVRALDSGLKDPQDRPPTIRFINSSSR